MTAIQCVPWLLVTAGRMAALRRVLLLLIAPLLASNSMAASYPERPITIVVPFTAGGIVDIVARKIAVPMSAALGQPVVVENKTGAAGIIGYAAVARAKPDGYSLVLASGSLTLGLAYQPSPDVHPVRSYSGIGMIGKIPQAIVVSQELPANSLAEFARIAKEKPGTLNFGSVGAGTTPFFTIELMRQIYDLDLLHVPYRGQPEMITDVLRGTLNISSVTAPLVAQHVSSKKMKAIAVTGRQRLPYLPDVATVYEQGVPPPRRLELVCVARARGSPAPSHRTARARVARSAAQPGGPGKLLEDGGGSDAGDTVRDHGFRRKRLRPLDRCRQDHRKPRGHGPTEVVRRVRT